MYINYVCIFRKDKKIWVGYHWSAIVELLPIGSEYFDGLAKSAEQGAGDGLRVSALSRLASEVKTPSDRIGQSIVMNA